MPRSKTILSSSVPAALYCLVVGATSSCTMQTKSQETLGPEAGASAPASTKPVEVDDVRATAASSVMTGSAAPASTVTTTMTTASAAGSSAPTPAANGSSPAPATASVHAASTPVAGSSPALTTAQAGSHAIDDDAGMPTTQPQNPGSVSQAKQDKCNADLAVCLIDSPLNYDGCLRMAANNGCPMPDAGAPTTTVLDDQGNPISQVCQAELAKCIMKLPTPENALACTEKARACK